MKKTIRSVKATLALVVLISFLIRIRQIGIFSKATIYGLYIATAIAAAIALSCFFRLLSKNGVYHIGGVEKQNLFFSAIASCLGIGILLFFPTVRNTISDYASFFSQDPSTWQNRFDEPALVVLVMLFILVEFSFRISLVLPTALLLSGLTSPDMENRHACRSQLVLANIIAILLTILSANILLIFCLIGATFFMIIRPRRIGVTALILSILTGLCLILPHVFSVMATTAATGQLAELFLPPLLFLVILLLYSFFAHAERYLLYTILLPVLVALAYFGAHILDLWLIHASGNEPIILPSYHLLLMTILLAAFIPPAIIAMRSHTKTIGAIFTLASLLAICLLPLSFNLRGDARFYEEFTALPSPFAANYKLQEDATFVAGGVKYGISDRGIIALEVVDEEMTEVTLTGYTGTVESATDAANALLPEQEIGTLFAVARGFLKNNDTVQVLTLPEELTLSYFEPFAIQDCSALREIRLFHTVPEDLADLPAVYATSLRLNKDTVLTVGDPEHTATYLTAFAPYAERIVWARDVYLTLTHNVAASYTPYQTQINNPAAILTRVGGESAFTLKAMLHNGTRVEDSCPADSGAHTHKILLYHAGDRIAWREGKPAVEISYHATADFKNMLGNLHTCHGSGIFTAEGRYTLEQSETHVLSLFSYGAQYNPRITVSVTTALVYE